MTDTEGRKAYIHIGPGKTGSTSVQAFVRQNRDELHARGLYIPTIRMPNGVSLQNHLLLATCKEITETGSLKSDAVLWPQLNDVLSAATHDLLLSSEHFRWEFLRTRSKFGRICAHLRSKGYRPVVLAYIRDQPAWLNSRYVQHVTRLFSQVSFDDYITGVMNDGSADPWQYLKPYIGNPDCDLRIIPFETSLKRGLETDFLKFCGVSDSSDLKIIGQKRLNAGSKAVYASEVIVKELEFKVYHLDDYLPTIKWFDKRRRKLGWDKFPYNDLAPERVDRIRAHYKDSNERFAQQFFGTNWNNICPSKIHQPSVFDPATATEAELDEINRFVRNTVKKFRNLKAGSLE